MADIALIWTDDNQGDIEVDGADLQTDEGLQTAVLISLFTDRRALDGEELPAGETSRRGWWGDVANAPGDFTGSRLWLLNREKQMPEVIARANEYTREALQWLIDDKVAQRVDIEVDGSTFERLAIGVIVTRPNGDIAKFRFGSLWANQLERAAF